MADEKDATDATNALERKTPVERLENHIPPWVVSSLRSKQQWKTFVRCWIAAWASFILMLPENSLKALGNAALFAVLGSLMVPPNMPIQLFILALAMMICGMLLGWGVGAAAMKAALAARDQNLLKSSLLRAQEGARGAVNPDAVFILDVFLGMFLDVRSSVIFGVFLGVFSFVFALSRTYVPRLQLFVVFGQIVLNIFCSYGPLFPVPQYTIVASLLISISCYMAIAIVCIIFVFPETMNHAYLVSVTEIFGKLNGYVQSQDTVLALSPEDIARDKDGHVSKSKVLRMELLGDVQALASKAALINVEFSYGRWNGDDAKALQEPLKLAVTRMCSFYSIPKLFEMYYPSSPKTHSVIATGHDSDSEATAEESDDVHRDTELVRQMFTHNRSKEMELNLRLDDIFPILRESTAELRAASSSALVAAQDVIQEINTFRWKRGAVALQAKEEAFDSSIEQLRSSLANFKKDKRFAFVQPFMSLLEDADAGRTTTKGLPLRSLLVSSAYAAQLVISAESLLELFELVRQTSHKRDHSRLWAPGGMRSLWKHVFSHDEDDKASKFPGEDTPPPVLTKEEKEEEAPYRVDPDSRPPSNIMQKLMDFIHKIYKWVKTKEVVFATKYTLITILLWLPAVFPSSANFYYVQKGFWALTMAQTTLNVYNSDQIYSYLTRLLGTFVGLVLGLLAWYIGNGNGNGNPYGCAASMAVFLAILVFFRINAPPAILLPVIMVATTLILIIGYSWTDGHLATIASPGIGWPIAWKRWVLVLIGCAASFIVMLLSPTSGRKAVRLQNAAIIAELSSVYTMLMSAWITEEESSSLGSRSIPSGAKDSDEEKWETNHTGMVTTNRPKWAEKFKSRVLPLALQLQALKMQTATARFEGNIRGAWPSDEYTLLLDREMEMLGAMAQLASALGHLDPTWRVTLNRRTLILNPNFMTDVLSIFALVSQSLRTSEPMHQILPTSLLDRLLYHREKHIETRADRLIDQSSYVERARSLDFMYYATGICAVSQIIWCLDDMHRTTKRLCGEIPFKGFDEWRNEYARVYEEAVESKSEKA